MDATLSRFLNDAARDAEIAAARVRRVIVPLVALRLLVVIGPATLMEGPKHWLTLSVLFVGLAASEAMLSRVRQNAGSQLLQVASVGLDAFMGLMVCLVGVVWAKQGYVGFLARSDWGIFPVLAVSAGLRLSRRVARLGASFALLSMAILVAADLSINGEQVVYSGGDIGLAAVIMIAAAMLGDAVALRARTLVTEGAVQAVSAERTKQRLGAYVSEEVAALALEGDEAKLGGEEREVAVLFSDLRGFTTYSETVAPEALVQELNAYLDDLVPAIHAEGGVVDKYIGDAIMAVFGAPHSRGDEACRAIRAAVAMGHALDAHNVRREARGLTPLRQGVGVHWGRVVAGNVGTQERLQYTVVGDAVNVASRLEGATKTEGVPLLLSEALVAQGRLEGSELPPLKVHGRIPVRGRHADLQVFTVG